WVRRQIPFLAPLVRWIARRSEAVTVISSHTAELVRRCASDVAVRVIPFGAAVAPGETAAGRVQADVIGHGGAGASAKEAAENADIEPVDAGVRTREAVRGPDSPAIGSEIFFVGRLVQR